MSAFARRVKEFVTLPATEPSVRVGLLAVVISATTAIAIVAVLWPRGASPAVPEKDPITVKRALSTVSARFGDTLTAEVDVVTDNAKVPAGSVKLGADFKPYEIVDTTTDLTHRGAATLRVTVYTLRCLIPACLPPTNGKPVRFPSLQVRYRQTGLERKLVVPWPGVALHSQLSGDPLVPVGIVDAPPVLSSGTRFTPGLLKLLLALGALGAGLVGALLLLQGLWPHTFYSLRRWRELTPLGRAMAQVDAAALVEDEPLRRQVLDRVATQLDAAGARELGLEARGLAWGPASPGQRELEGFAERVREVARAERR